ncbi:type II secretion system protein GspN [Pseudobacteriovorax antillogorgiicola]|uniref:Type II secretion system protein N n=1 Tax=Pseudobacteriovorax antillogorgiicola TaxID=1513793 RepID=A0A1Y6BDL0_9BACT|nr:type II secretion system protein GspN [Pseudobacteriovorax antillogorgiicola]TCS58707.1 type II secretion system protein N [Pseudobacteriovorax antillogorgiicola]SME95586.1 type II secretion system protein N [Pseudobacteriovorax antillogorgiicola]
MTEKKGRPLLYIFLFVFSFVFFLYLTFPYGVLKEAIVVEISKATGYSIRVKEFGPSLPLGFECEGVQVTSRDGTQRIEIEEVDVSLSVFALLIGRVSVDADLVSKGGGEMSIGSSWGILQLAVDQNFIPNYVELEADEFDIGSLASFGIQSYAKSANDMIKGTLNKLRIDGNLEGTVELDLAVDDPTASSGTVDLRINKGMLDLNDENLGVAKQKFKKAVVQASLEKGALRINKKSGFHTQELTVDLNGNTTFRNPLPNSRLNVGVDVKLDGKLKENFDFFLNMAGGKNGTVTYKLSGTLGRPSFRTQ